MVEKSVTSRNPVLSATILYHRGLVYEKQEDWESAEKDFLEVVELLKEVPEGRRLARKSEAALNRLND